ncbi:MAG: hypothetical protein M0P71_18335, partial [Melioribacteraceae bacterium]|nr:hypothetical protein [Melioribacteraceae bacterium]
MNKKSPNLHYYIGGIILFSVIIFFFFSRDNEIKTNEDSAKTIIIAGHISEAHQILIENFNKKHLGKIQVKSVNLSFQKFSTDEQKELFARFLRSESDKID